MKNSYPKCFIIFLLPFILFSCANGFGGDKDEIPKEHIGGNEATITSFIDDFNINLSGYFNTDEEYQNRKNHGIVTDGITTQINTFDNKERGIGGNYYIKKIVDSKIPESIKQEIDARHFYASIDKIQYFAIDKNPIKYISINKSPNGVQVSGVDFLLVLIQGCKKFTPELNQTYFNMFGKINTTLCFVTPPEIVPTINEGTMIRSDLEELNNVGEIRDVLNFNDKEYLIEYKSLNETFLTKLESKLKKEASYLLFDDKKLSKMIKNEYKYLYVHLYDIGKKQYKYKIGLSNDNFTYMTSPSSFRYTDIITYEEFRDLYDLNISHAITDIKEYEGFWSYTKNGEVFGRLNIIDDGKTGFLSLKDESNKSTDYQCSFIKRNNATYLRYKNNENIVNEYFIYKDSPTQITFNYMNFIKQKVQ